MAEVVSEGGLSVCPNSTVLIQIRVQTTLPRQTGPLVPRKMGGRGVREGRRKAHRGVKEAQPCGVVIESRRGLLQGGKAQNPGCR